MLKNQSKFVGRGIKPNYVAIETPLKTTAAVLQPEKNFWTETTALCFE